MGNTKKMYEEMVLQELINKMYETGRDDDDYQYEMYREHQQELMDRQMEQHFERNTNGE